MSNDVERILAQIADLSTQEKTTLFERLESEGGAATGSGNGAPQRFAVGDLNGPADYVIVFDGGSHGNPGPGYGSYAVAPKGAKKPGLTRLDFDRRMTNNEAEYEALIAALEGLSGEIEAGGQKAAEKTIEIRGDSTLAIRQIEGSWKTKNSRMRALRNRARELLADFGGHRLVIQGRAESVRVLGH
ncbi:MAG: ribonuclease HI family protein [Anaerolineales bacterium]|nr:MAG: ribonuclease HI family protein [Anaerolineales bacterium]